MNTAETSFRTYTLVNFIFENLHGGRRFSFTIQGFPEFDAVWKETVCISLGSGYWGLRDILTEGSRGLAWDMLKKIRWSESVDNRGVVIK